MGAARARCGRDDPLRRGRRARSPAHGDRQRSAPAERRRLQPGARGAAVRRPARRRCIAGRGVADARRVHLAHPTPALPQRFRAGRAFGGAGHTGAGAWRPAERRWFVFVGTLGAGGRRTGDGARARDRSRVRAGGVRDAAALAPETGGARRPPPARARTRDRARRMFRTCWRRPVPSCMRSRHDVRLETTTTGARGKFENLDLLLQRCPADGFDWLLVIDDDVALPRGFLDAFMCLRRAVRAVDRPAGAPVALARRVERHPAPAGLDRARDVVRRDRTGVGAARTARSRRCCRSRRCASDGGWTLTGRRSRASTAGARE